MEEKQKPLISAVILLYNRKDDVIKNIEALLKNNYKNIEIIVCDNNSEDGAPEYIESNFPEVKLLEMDSNIGIKALNKGFKKAEGKYILILDDDSLVLEDSIGKAVQKMEKDNKVGAIACNIHDTETKEPWKTVYYPKEQKSQDWYVFIGCGAFLRKNIFEKAGYYPNDYFLFENELEPSVKILNLGYKIKFYPEIITYHKFAKKVRAKYHHIYYPTRNDLIFAFRCLPILKAIHFSLGTLLYHFLLAVASNNLRAYFKALINFTKNIKIIKNRKIKLKKEVLQQIKPLLEKFYILNVLKYSVQKIRSK